jgi:pyrroloquinoline quinone (PQQ) biosynthesis protein C
VSFVRQAGIITRQQEFHVSAALQRDSDFFIELESITHDHRVLRHEFLLRLEQEIPTLQQLQRFSSQHYLYSKGFSQNLAAVIANTPDEDARTLLILNMYEEIGEPTRIRDRVHMLLLEAGLITGVQLGAAFERLAQRPIDGDVVTQMMNDGIVSRTQVAAAVERSTSQARDLSHPALFRRYLRAIGLDHAVLATLSPIAATTEFSRTYRTMCRDAHWLEALGAMGPGTESIVARVYSKILQGIVASGLVTAHDYVFWTLHVHCDDGHGRNIIESMRPYAVDAANRERILRGAVAALEARARWLDALYDHVYGDCAALAVGG